MDMQYAFRRTFPAAYEWLREFKHPNSRVVAQRFSAAHGPELLAKTRQIQFALESGHTQEEILQVIDAVLTGPPGAVVEAGCWKGASAAKLSLACAKTERPLHLFDSFEGLPENSEVHGKNTDGKEMLFEGGAFAGSLETVKDTIRRFGDPSVCQYHKGWFSETMPHFSEPVAVAYVDVDLASSTEDCMSHLYPLLVPGGVIYSQDGHVPLVLDYLRKFQVETGARIDGLGERKLLAIRRP